MCDFKSGGGSPKAPATVDTPDLTLLHSGVYGALGIAPSAP